MVGAAGEALIGQAALGQVGDLGGQQAKFLGQFDGGPADLLADLLDGRLDGHAALHADQQQVEGVGEGADDRLAPLLGGVGDEDIGGVVAGGQGRDGDREPRHGRQAEVVQQEEIGAGQHREDEGQHEAEEVEGADGTRASIAGLGERFDDLGIFQQPRELQTLHDLLVEAFVDVTQSARAAALGKGRARLAPQLFAAAGDRLQTGLQIAAVQHRQGDGDDGREGDQRHEGGQQVRRVGERLDHVRP